MMVKNVNGGGLRSLLNSSLHKQRGGGLIG